MAAYRTVGLGDRNPDTVVRRAIGRVPADAGPHSGVAVLVLVAVLVPALVLVPQTTS